MKTYIIFCFSLLILTQPCFSQYDTTMSDLNIARRLINQPVEKLTTIIEDFDFEIYITNSSDTRIQFYLQRGDISVRSFALKVGNIYKESDSDLVVITENICTEVFVRYNHDNFHDLRDFFSYDIPQSTKYVNYEKNLGEHNSHLRITMKDN